MTLLHGILAKLGIDFSMRPPEHGIDRDREWIVDQKFMPIEGLSYEIAFGKILYRGALRHVMRRICAMGGMPCDWIDLDIGAPLEKELRQLPVRGFRKLS